MNIMYRFDLSVGHTMACGRVLPAKAVRLAIKDALAADNIQNYTLAAAEGCWAGGDESTTVITVLEPCPHRAEAKDDLFAKYHRLAARLATVLHQECVMLTHTNVSCSFVRPASEEN